MNKFGTVLDKSKQILFNYIILPQKILLYSNTYINQTN